METFVYMDKSRREKNYWRHIEPLNCSTGSRPVIQLKIFSLERSDVGERNRHVSLQSAWHILSIRWRSFVYLGYLNVTSSDSSLGWLNIIKTSYTILSVKECIKKSHKYLINGEMFI